MQNLDSYEYLTEDQIQKRVKNHYKTIYKFSQKFIRQIDARAQMIEDLNYYFDKYVKSKI